MLHNKISPLIYTTTVIKILSIPRNILRIIKHAKPRKIANNRKFCIKNKKKKNFSNKSLTFKIYPATIVAVVMINFCYKVYIFKLLNVLD